MRHHVSEFLIQLWAPSFSGKHYVHFFTVNTCRMSVRACMILRHTPQDPERRMGSCKSTMKNLHIKFCLMSPFRISGCKVIRFQWCQHQIPGMLVKHWTILQLSFLGTSVDSVRFTIVKDFLCWRNKLHQWSTARNNCSKGEWSLFNSAEEPRNFPVCPSDNI